jgi:hypothetical protein
VAVVGGLRRAGPATADLTFRVDIKGTIFTADAPTANVTCKGKHGTKATFPNADVDVESLAAFSFPTSCSLNSAAGVFGDGERFNGQMVDAEATAVIVTKKGVEVSQRFYATSKITNGNGEATMTAEYASSFVKDKANGELDPPLKSAKGTVILVLDGTPDQFFVGTFKTGSLVPWPSQAAARYAAALSPAWNAMQAASGAPAQRRAPSPIPTSSVAATCHGSAWGRAKSTLVAATAAGAPSRTRSTSSSRSR